MPRISKKYQLITNWINFQIGVTFPDCDVDTQLANEAQWVPHFHDTKGTSTPIEVTVAQYIAVLTQIDLDDANFNRPLEERTFGKAQIAETYGFIQGFCSITFKVDPDELESLNELQEIIDHCKKVMRSHAKIIKYYKNKHPHHYRNIG